MNVNDFGSYTVYWKKVLWDDAINADVVTEDFEMDGADFGVLSFPFFTGHGFILDGGETSAQILSDNSLLSSGNLLHLRSWGSGLRFIFPDKTHVSAFGFEFRASEEWRLMIEDIGIALPKGRAGFIGIQMYWGGPTQFTLTSLKKAQGGLAVDNISYVSSPLP